MNKTYHFNVPKILVNIIHIFFGVWITYIGYKTIKKEEINKINYNILLVFGILLLVYFPILIYKNFSDKWNYSFRVPNYAIFGVHIVNAIIFIMIGLKKIPIENLMSLYLIISGSMASLYHKHIIYYDLVKK